MTCYRHAYTHAYLIDFGMFRTFYFNFFFFKNNLSNCEMKINNEIKIKQNYKLKEYYSNNINTNL